jgi:hypothetical protein
MKIKLILIFLTLFLFSSYTVIGDSPIPTENDLNDLQILIINPMINRLDESQNLQQAWQANANQIAGLSHRLANSRKLTLVVMNGKSATLESIRSTMSELTNTAIRIIYLTGLSKMEETNEYFQLYNKDEYIALDELKQWAQASTSSLFIKDLLPLQAYTEYHQCAGYVPFPAVDSRPQTTDITSIRKIVGKINGHYLLANFSSFEQRPLFSYNGGMLTLSLVYLFENSSSYLQISWNNFLAKVIEKNNEIARGLWKREASKNKISWLPDQQAIPILLEGPLITIDSEKTTN